MFAKRLAIFKHGPGQQRGAALLIMLIIMVVGITTVLVKALTSSTVKTARQETTAAALAQAKEALIGYAVTYGDTHTTPPEVSGYLPCPDTSSGSEGVAASSCNSQGVSAIGRLPWATLDLSALRDGDGECLWYVVSGTYKSGPKSSLMNWDNNGQFQILAASGVTLAGQTPDSYAVAVVFAPGVTLNGQNRSPDGTAPICGGNYTASNYLDHDATISANNAAPSTVANAISQFFNADATTNINDHIIFITRSDIFNAIKKRNDFGAFISNALSSTATSACLAALPAPVTINFNNTPPTETQVTTPVGNLKIGRVPKICLASPLDNWQDHFLYATCTTASCLNVNGNISSGVVIFSGERNASQTRITNADKNIWSNYLEDAPSAILTAFTTGGTSFSGASSYSTASTSTDVLAWIP